MTYIAQLSYMEHPCSRNITTVSERCYELFRLSGFFEVESNSLKKQNTVLNFWKSILAPPPHLGARGRSPLAPPSLRHCVQILKSLNFTFTRLTIKLTQLKCKRKCKSYENYNLFISNRRPFSEHQSHKHQSHRRRNRSSSSSYHHRHKEIYFNNVKFLLKMMRS